MLVVALAAADRTWIAGSASFLALVSTPYHIVAASPRLRKRVAASAHHTVVAAFLQQTAVAVAADHTAFHRSRAGIAGYHTGLHRIHLGSRIRPSLREEERASSLCRFSEEATTPQSDALGICVDKKQIQ